MINFIIENSMMSSIDRKKTETEIWKMFVCNSPCLYNIDIIPTLGILENTRRTIPENIININKNLSFVLNSDLDDVLRLVINLRAMVLSRFNLIFQSPSVGYQ